MAEFVIGLPVFVLMFVGIASFLRIGQAAVVVKAEAHAKMWEEAIPITTDLIPEWSMNPELAAGQAGWFHNQTGGNALDLVLDSGSGAAAATGISGALMAESYSRVKPVDIVEDIGDANEKVTYNLNEDYIIADSNSVSNDLMNDALDFSPNGGGGALGALNSMLTLTGSRPAIAGGVRYGISGAFATKEVKLFNGQIATFEARSHVANAPRPTSRYITVAVVRLAMTKEDRYDTAIEFDMTPDLSGILDAANAILFGGKGDAKDKGNGFKDQLLAMIPCRGSLCGQ